MNEHRSRSSNGPGASEPSAVARQEAVWVTQVREGNEQALERIFFAYYGRLSAFGANYLGRPDVARDVVQEVFLKIWERHASWTVHSSLKAYLYQAVRNQALDYLRRKRSKNAVEAPMSPAVDEMAEPHTADELLIYHETVRAVRNAMRQLPERRQTAFLLHRQHGLTYDEIAQVMSISPRTVEVHIGKALKSLHTMQIRLGQG